MHTIELEQINKARAVVTHRPQFAAKSDRGLLIEEAAAFINARLEGRQVTIVYGDASVTPEVSKPVAPVEQVDPSFDVAAQTVAFAQAQQDDEPAAEPVPKVALDLAALSRKKAK